MLELFDAVIRCLCCGCLLKYCMHRLHVECLFGD